MSNYIDLCTKLLNEYISSWESEPFLDPVPWREWKLFDYPTIIKTPMDLHTVQRKLENGEYSNAYAFANDVRLIWNNCLTYNPEGSEICSLAKRLQAKFEESFRQLEKSLSPNEQMPTIEMRTTFANNFAYLSAPQITHIVSELKRDCPEALIEVNEGVCDIKVDVIPIPLFHSLNNYISDSVASNFLVYYNQTLFPHSPPIFGIP